MARPGGQSKPHSHARPVVLAQDVSVKAPNLVFTISVSEPVPRNRSESFVRGDLVISRSRFRISRLGWTWTLVFATDREHGLNPG
jgi:hypothetical protein